MIPMPARNGGRSRLNPKNHYLLMRKAAGRMIRMGRKRFSDQVRDAVDASGMSRYAICKAIGLNQGAMSRFMAGNGGLSMDTLDRLAELLGLRIVAERKEG